MSGANSQAVAKHRQKRRREIIYIMGGKCALCGYNKCEAALEMHHIDPTEKEYQLSSGNCKQIEEDLKEAKKCVLLCANCHREVHAGLIPADSLKSSYDEEKAKEVLDTYKQYKFKKNNIHKCIRCGKEIQGNQRYCVNCANEIKQAHIRPSREELKRRIRKDPFTEIGEDYGVANTSVVKWCKKYNLPWTKKEINKLSDKDWEKI